MARDPWLTLPEHMGHLADREIHIGEQPQDTQACWVGKGAGKVLNSHTN